MSIVNLLSFVFIFYRQIVQLKEAICIFFHKSIEIKLILVWQKVKMFRLNRPFLSLPYHVDILFLG